MSQKIELVDKKSPTIVFCLTGNNFSGRFLDSFIALTYFCQQNNIKYHISRRECPVVYYVRNMCLGGDLRKGVDQKPFNGNLDYTHLMWIDSDMVFTTDHFQALLKHEKDIVSGIYKMEDNEHFTVIENWNVEYLKQHGTFQFLTNSDMQNKTGLFNAVYTGFGFMLIKRGVFEALKYPWFEPLFFQFDNIIEFCSEDVSFCKKAKDKGFDIWVDPAIRIGHEKKIVL